MVVERSAGHHDVVDDSEDALAAHVGAVLAFQVAIRQHGGAVQADGAPVHPRCEGGFVRVEVLEARLALDLTGLVAQHVADRLGGVEDVSVCNTVRSKTRAIGAGGCYRATGRASR